jgi:integrase
MPYDLRHFKGKSLKKRGIPDSVGAAYLGHSVEIYAHTYGQLDVGDIDDVLKLFPQQQKVI